MTYDEQLKAQELNKKILEDIREKYTDNEINDYYFNHTKPDTMLYFGLRTLKQLDKLLKLTTYNFSLTKPTLRNCVKPENRRSQESYINGGKKSAKTQTQNWKSKTEKEKEEWSLKQKQAHSSVDFKQAISQINKKRFSNMTEEELANYKKVRSEANKKKWNIDRESILAKAYETKKTNKSFNSSKTEDIYFNILCNKYGAENIIRQYKDLARYPFACDFYVKSLDLFIELNISWTHGGHLFSESNLADQKKLASWIEKSKTSDYYKKAIYTWTDLDVRKQKVAEENKLNYLVYYSEGELYE